MNDAEFREFSRLAGRFHQDFDVEGISFIDGVRSHFEMLEEGERSVLLSALKKSVVKFPDNDAFRKEFIRSGAEHFGNYCPRAEVIRFLGLIG